MIKLIVATALLLTLKALYADSGVRGRVESIPACGPKVMVWLSLDKDLYRERTLLLHTEVPVRGTFQFYLKPGKYQLRASDEKGCGFLRKLDVRDGVETLNVAMATAVAE